MELDPMSPKYLRFVRAVLEHNEGTEYSVSRLGSGIVIVHEGAFYLVTARHVVTQRGTDPTKIMATFPESGINSWQTVACVHLEAADGYQDDNAFGDVAVYRLQEDRAIVSSVSDFDFLPFPKEMQLAQGTPLYATGFPDQECDIDLDKRQHLLTVAAVEGWYEGATPYRGLHVFRSSSFPLSQNGMSGGAITCLDPNRVGRHVLMGLIVQGGYQKLHFIDAKTVGEAVRYAMFSMENRERSLVRGNITPVGSGPQCRAWQVETCCGSLHQMSHITQPEIFHGTPEQLLEKLTALASASESCLWVAASSTGPDIRVAGDWSAFSVVERLTRDGWDLFGRDFSMKFDESSQALHFALGLRQPNPTFVRLMNIDGSQRSMILCYSTGK